MNKEQLEDFSLWIRQNTNHNIDLVGLYETYCRQKGEPSVDDLPQWRKPRMHGVGVKHVAV